MSDEWAEKLAIQELCARYCLTIDAQDAAGWAGCFAPDGAFEYDGWVIRGRPALTDYAAVHDRFLRCRHMTFNHFYEVMGHRAVGFCTTVVTQATQGGYKILGQGMYEDQLVKVDGTWHLAHRTLRPDRAVDESAKPLHLGDPDVAALVKHLLDAAERLGRRVAP
jgi:hypothetical protein